MIARELIEGYGLKQEQVAMKLGVTQAAVSKYRHQVRGEAVELEAAEEGHKMSSDLVASIARHSRSFDVSQEFCQSCTDNPALSLMCVTCCRVEPAWDVADFAIPV